MKARDIMHKRVLAVHPETPLPELVELLTEHDISGVPVVGPKGDLVGVVSQADLLRRDHAGKTVSAVMTPWSVSFEEDTDVRELARQMASKKIHRLIVTREGRLCGIISSMDMIRALLELLGES